MAEESDGIKMAAVKKDRVRPLNDISLALIATWQ
jgi:hypothetical protein